MSDKLIKALAQDGQVRIIAAVTTELVNEGAEIHKCSATAAAAFGRMLTAGVLVGTMQKNDNDKLTLKIDGKGAAEGIIVTSYGDGHVKGFIGNPLADLPENEKGKLDVGGIVGINGSLLVIRDMGLKEPYVGQVPIQTGEIGDDLAYYFTASEQTPSAVGLGVLVDKDLSIKASGGFIIQMLPGFNEFVADIITYRLKEIPSVTDMILKGMTAQEMIEYIFDGMDLKIIGEEEPKYHCDCSRERVEKALLSIGKKDLTEIFEEGKEEEIICHFCNESYKFTNEQIGELLRNI